MSRTHFVVPQGHVSRLAHTLAVVGTEVQRFVDEHDDFSRCCSCGADKGFLGIAHDNVFAVTPLIREAARTKLQEDWKVNDERITGVFGYIVAAYPPEPCDDGCPHKDMW